MNIEENPDNFLIYSFNNELAEQSFSQRNKEVLKPLKKLLEATDKILKQINHTDGNAQLMIYVLGRLCFRHFESILLLCSNEHGFSAARILRSMFEKCIDAYYLNNNPGEVDDFINYYFVQLKKLGYIDIAKGLDPNFQTVIGNFKTGKKTRLTWSEKDLIQKAKSVGADDYLINYAYRHPNYLIHSSMSEVMYNIRVEADGSITATDQEENHAEQAYADVALSLGCDIAARVLQLQIEAFNLPPEPLLKEFSQELEIALKKTICA